jgi:H+/Cl- antiporter ClcA
MNRRLMMAVLVNVVAVAGVAVGLWLLFGDDSVKLTEEGSLRQILSLVACMVLGFAAGLASSAVLRPAQSSLHDVVRDVLWHLSRSRPPKGGAA